MKKLLSLLLSSAMLISTLPVHASDSANADTYFTDTRTVDYTKSYYQGHSGKYSTDADAYKFVTKDGDYFSLLDVKDDKNSKYFIITSKLYATAASFKENNVAEYFGMPAADLTFSSDDEKNYQYPSWGLNGNMFKNSYGYNNAVSVRISDTARSCIDWNHTWTVDPTPDAKIPNAQYTYTAGITYPSMGEISTYADRFMEYNTAGITTRNFINNANLEQRRVAVVGTNNTNKWDMGGWSLQTYNVPVRPVFWANDQFFATVAVDLSTAGAAVMQEIKKIQPAKLASLYSAEEMQTYFGIDVSKIDFYYADTRTVDYTKSYYQGDSGKYSTDADAYKFVTKDGDYFSLLDVKDDKNSKYFIITSKLYATAASFKENNVAEYFGMPAAGLTFSSDDEKNYQYPSWGLNGKMFKNSYGYNNAVSVRISDTARSCIDWNHTWTVEPTPNNTTLPNQKYTYTAGIAYPSMAEIVTYADRFMEPNTGSITTRTFINNAISYRAPIVVATTNDSSWSGSGWGFGPNNFPVRPVFWANDQFFATVAVDLSTAGAAVKQEIKKVSLDKLLEMYTPDDIRNVLGLKIPDETINLYNVDVKTRSGNEPAYGETLIAGYNLLSDSSFKVKKVEITWKKQEGTTVTTIGTGDEYIVTEADAATGNTQIYFDLAVTGATGKTITKTSHKTTINSLGVAPVEPNTTFDMIKNTNKANTFKVGGKTFTLIDTFDNDESTFFVTVNDDYGLHGLDTIYMDPSDPSNYAYWMDNTFKNYGNNQGDETGKVLPGSIVKYINNNHIWLTEGAPKSPLAVRNDKIEAQNYSFTAGIAALSVSELKRYSNVIGSADGVTQFFTRTGSNYTNATNNTTEYICCAATGSAGNTDANKIWMPPWNAGSGTYIRPAFYLTREFFKNVDIKTTDIGANVWKAMAEIYSIEELTSIYDEETLEDKGFTSKSTLAVNYSKYGDSTAVYEKLEGATSLQANVTYTTEKGGINAIAILALYDGNDKLVNVVRTPIISSENTVTAALGFETLSDIGIGHYTKLMIWNDMKPVTKVDVFGSDKGLNLATGVSVLTSASVNEGNNFF